MLFRGCSFFQFNTKHLCVFFSASTQRWAVLLLHVSNFNLKPLSNTRRESKIDVLKSLRFQIGNVHDTLMDIVVDDPMTGLFSNLVRVEAPGLVQKMINFEFVASLVGWFNILFEINIESKLLH